MADEANWNNLELMQSIQRESSQLETTLNMFASLDSALGGLDELIEMAAEENDEDTFQSIVENLQSIEAEIEVLEFNRMFRLEEDACNAFLDIQAGSGGTEAQDWAQMLLRMYERFIEHQGFKYTLMSQSPGDVAGIKHASIKVEGDHAYGWLRSELGVHRLVRKSPFDSGNRRHTSFASVFVSPEIKDDHDIVIDPSQLRIDTFRSSGAGGQHVNTTDSAVRITHIESGIVVQCQNDRSQHKNKAQAMTQLKAKLYQLRRQEQMAKQQALESSKTDISWGAQIRSYVLDQSRIKDLRTGVEKTNTQAVLDGDITDFIVAYLKQHEDHDE